MKDDVTKPWWRDSLFTFTKVSAWIAVPIVMALFIGKYFDALLGTKPWLFLSTMAIAFFISILGIYKTTAKEMAKTTDISNEDINGNNN